MESGDRRGDEGETSSTRSSRCTSDACGAREVPGKDDEHEPCPCSDEPGAAEVAHEQVHRHPGEHEARQDDEVVGGDLADDLRRKVGGVVGE